VLTTLTRRMLPLVRYDLDDEAEIVDPRAANAALAELGSELRLERPAVAVWGRRGGTIHGDGWSLRPEIAGRAFTTSAHAGPLTGRFRIESETGNRSSTQPRNGALPGPGSRRRWSMVTVVAGSWPASRCTATASISTARPAISSTRRPTSRPRA
jgi:hypothetical protein